MLPLAPDRLSLLIYPPTSRWKDLVEGVFSSNRFNALSPMPVTRHCWVKCNMRAVFKLTKSSPLLTSRSPPRLSIEEEVARWRNAISSSRAEAGQYIQELQLIFRASLPPELRCAVHVNCELYNVQYSVHNANDTQIAHWGWESMVASGRNLDSGCPRPSVRYLPVPSCSPQHQIHWSSIIFIVKSSNLLHNNFSNLIDY